MLILLFNRKSRSQLLLHSYSRTLQATVEHLYSCSWVNSQHLQRQCASFTKTFLNYYFCS
uniref:Uncharacterized protein n=1 Tax=Anguilla anguilla TaxID=7936 RepID=A0A0E9RKW5_ANGAN